MRQKQAVKFSHVIHTRRREVEEAGGRRRRRRRGGRHKGWFDAVSVIKPASTNTNQVKQTE